MRSGRIAAAAPGTLQPVNQYPEQAFLAQRPGVTIDLQERLTRDIIHGVLEGSTDMCIVAGPVASTELQVLHFSTDRLVLVVPINASTDTLKQRDRPAPWTRAAGRR